jgi:ATP-dependent exoDNAse (exonuclease V) beta subunit
MVSDQPARDQIRDAHDVNLFIEAGAGTGKTSALVDRVVALVTAGQVELRHLAAITFTEAAAAELRDRVRAALEQVAVDSEHADDGRRALSRAALDQLDDAALSTLHGFAHRLVSEHPFDVGLPPGFRVLDEIETSVDFEQRWAGLVDDLFADPTLEPALLTWLGGGLTVGRLRSVALALCEHHDRLTAAGLLPLLPSPRAAELGDAIDGLLALRREGRRVDGDKLAAHIDGLIPYRDALAAARDPLDVLGAIYRVPPLRCALGQARCWTDVDLVRAACEEAEAVRESVVAEPRRAALAILVDRLVAFATRYAEDRRRDGRLWFHDLLVLARDLLRDHPDARAAAAERYRCLLVDEFQDTDPLQVELAVLLASSPSDGAGRDWTEARIRPGALTLVGDPKQAIYRFRNADLRVYHETRARLGLRPVALVENFRSTPTILDTVNAVFARLLDEVAGIQAAHVPLRAHRGRGDLESRVAILGGAEARPIVEIREDEAAAVAATARQIIAEGWPVRAADGAVRPAVARDVALLIPSRTVLPALEVALEQADVPVRVESQSLVYATAEVRDLLAVLTTIDDPTDEIAVVASLRSPALGCTDADLVAHVAASGGWDYRREAATADDTSPVALGLRRLRACWEQRWWRTVSGTVDAVVRDLRLLELAARHRRPRDHWRRIRFLVDQARAWEDAGETSLRGFVEWAGRQAEEGARVNESVAGEPDDPALRILTVHGAKGLEFPIVILAGLNVAPSNQLPPVLWGPAGPEVRVGNQEAGTRAETAGYPACASDERAIEAAERLRLLYVAMTRARDHLVISLYHRTGSRCHAARLSAELAGTPLETLEPRPVVAVTTTVRDRPASADPDARDHWIERRQALLGAAGAPESVAATTLAELAAEEPEPEARPPWQRGRAGTAIGRAVHAVLQTVDLATGAGLEATARAQALAEGVTDREEEVRGLAAAVLASPSVRALTAGGWPRWREVPVAAAVDGTLVEGFIDLLVRSPEGLVVVDYKTDAAPTAADLDAAAARYAVQGAAYALALEATLGEPVTRCVFVFARQPAAVERVVEDLDAAKREVRARLRATRVR